MHKVATHSRFDLGQKTMTASDTLVPTQSAQAMHLLCCMIYSMNEACSDYKRKWASEHPFSDCVAENLQPLDSTDPGLLLLAKIAGCDQIDSDALMKDVQQTIASPLFKNAGLQFPSLQDHLVALLELKKAPSGWMQVESLWEHLTGTSLSHVISHIPMTTHMDPSDDFSNGCRYFVESVWFQDTGDFDEEGDSTYYSNDLHMMLVGNELSAILSRLEGHASRCDNHLLSYGRTQLGAIKINICDGPDKYIMSMVMPDMTDPQNYSKARYDLSNLRILGQKDLAISAIKKGLGENGYLNVLGHEFTRDIGL